MSEPVQIQPNLPQIKDFNLLRFLSDEDITEFLSFAEIVAFQKGEKSSTSVISANTTTEL